MSAATMSSFQYQIAGAETLRPRYAEKFRCIGAACEDTCCQGWNVFIDKTTYAKYRSISDGPLRVLVEQRLERTGNASDFEYAKVKLNDDDVCPFLAHDRLCSIQKKYGEGHLSLTCSQYPRSFKTVDSASEQTLLLSCPEAARLVLLDRKLVPRRKKSQPVSRYQGVAELCDSTVPQASTPMAWFLPVRNFVVLLIQDRTYSLWQRVFLLHMFCKRLQEWTARHGWEGVPALLAEYAGMIASGSLRVALDSIPAQTEIQLAVLMVLLEERDTSPRRNQRFAECIDDFALGIGYQTGSTPAALVQNYMEAHGRYFQPWAVKHGFILENYLLNYVFSSLFPFGKPGTEQGLHPLRESLLLCFQFGLIKGLLIGMAGRFQSEFSRDHVVKLVQSFSKAVQHNAGLINRIEGFFAASGLNNTNGIAALLHEGPSRQPPSIEHRVP